ncbi:hypothetical protein [Pseudoalteromonas rubra]|uniref:Uncharacterized protein n=1 Tax=Pseudoalteromonas rubra TaxID=43658 RepID=A0A0F4QF34_9GAMM|nr:hypothetical protein [Pseudoalteromonas rubra]KJZ05910.1 hypothetical protein TW77_21335 [Pseudoalteromonas rubra]
MIEKIILEVQQHLPLKVSFSSWNGDVLTMSGENWSFHTLGAWRVISNGVVEFACWDEGAEDKILETLDTEVIRVSVQGRQIAIDPVFELSTGKKLEIFTSETIEPWVLSLPNGRDFCGAST